MVLAIKQTDMTATTAVIQFPSQLSLNKILFDLKHTLEHHPLQHPLNIKYISKNI